MDAKCKCFDGLDGAVSFRETFGETKVMQIRQGETLNYQGAITYEVCCLAAQSIKPFSGFKDEYQPNVVLKTGWAKSPQFYIQDF